MSGKYRGVQARVKELYPLVMYTHCCNHVLNLAISTSSQLPVIRNAMATQGYLETPGSDTPKMGGHYKGYYSLS